MEDPQGRIPGSDDTAAFQRFYADQPGPADEPRRGRLYKLLFGWWRERS